MRANELIETLTRVQKAELFRIMTGVSATSNEESVYKHFYRQELKKALARVVKIEKILVEI